MYVEQVVRTAERGDQRLPALGWNESKNRAPFIGRFLVGKIDPCMGMEQKPAHEDDDIEMRSFPPVPPRLDRLDREAE